MSDLIDRKTALDGLEYEMKYGAEIDRCGLDTAYDIIENIPSAEPERKKGQWIKEDLSGYFTPGGNSIYHCSECGHTEGPWPHPRLTNFCPSCSADMRGE